jgi:hypothetical protein
MRAISPALAMLSSLLTEIDSILAASSRVSKNDFAFSFSLTSDPPIKKAVDLGDGIPC